MPTRPPCRTGEHFNATATSAAISPNVVSSCSESDDLSASALRIRLGLDRIVARFRCSAYCRGTQVWGFNGVRPPLKEPKPWMPSVQSTTAAQSREESSRFRIAVFLQRAEEIGFWWQSPRQVAKRLGVPDSSFRFHLRRREQLIRDPELSPGLVRFLESPDGGSVSSPPARRPASGVRTGQRLRPAKHRLVSAARWTRQVPTRLVRCPAGFRREAGNATRRVRQGGRTTPRGPDASPRDQPLLRTKPFIPKSVWWRWSPSPITSCWSSTPRNATPTLGGSASTSGWRCGRSPCVRSPATKPRR